MTYAFEGQTIRLNRKDYDTWKRVFYAIPDFDAKLFSLDVYYTDQNVKNWFVRCSAALLKAHDEGLAKGAEKPVRSVGYDLWTLEDKQRCARVIAQYGRAKARSQFKYLKSEIERVEAEGWLQPRSVEV